MKSLRLKLSIALVCGSIGLAIYAWGFNTYNLDILRTKNDATSRHLRIEIESSNDTTFLKSKAVELLESSIHQRKFTNEISSSVLRFLSASIVLSVIGLVTLLIEYWKRRTL
jgi:hypothetical protein